MKMHPAWVALTLCVLSRLPAAEVTGVTEPVREVDLSFPEPGILRVLAVEEGDAVTVGQVLGSLDNRILEARLGIARIRAQSSAQLEAARAELQMRSRRLTQIEALASKRSANEDELAKARADQAAADAAVRLASEEREMMRMETALIEAQIEQRTLRSPIAGVVTRLYRDAGENVSQSDLVVLTLACLDPLEIVVHVETALARDLKAGQVLQVRERERGLPASASVVFISPVTEASSGTTRLRLRLPNPDGTHRSGLKYAVTLPEPAAAAP
jgi:RND family efflux transporter MFP subunit